jgi:hypothetical protein
MGKAVLISLITKQKIDKECFGISAGTNMKGVMSPTKRML